MTNDNPRVRDRSYIAVARRPERAEQHPPEGEREMYRQQQANSLDAVIDRSLRTGEPARPLPEELDDAEDAVGRKLSNLEAAPEFQKEYKLKLVHRMLMRQLSMDLIAQALGCSVRYAYMLREQLFAQLREEATNKDLPTYVGLTDGFYNDIIGMALRMASNRNVGDQRKISAMQVALQAQRDRVHFYEVIGFHDVMKLSPASGMFDKTTEQADTLISMTKGILDVFSDDMSEVVEQPKAKQNDYDVFRRRDRVNKEETQAPKVRVL